MRGILRYVVFSFPLALAVGAAQGKECKGISFSEQMQSEGATLELNGLGLRQATFPKIDVYVGALYVAQTSTDANAILNQDFQSVVRELGGAPPK